jgi:hypothetical protein
MVTAYANGAEIPAHTETRVGLLPFPTNAWAAAWYVLQRLTGEPLQQPYYLYGVVVLGKPAVAGERVHFLYEADFAPNPVRWERLEQGEGE